jgi:crotonobetainyl-CoA:carnitine CoA-transferase CaiB-like acyl-CoA transferase
MQLGKLADTAPRTKQTNPMVNVYQAGDGKWFWLLGVEADRMWPKLLAAIDRKQWGDDDRFKSARDRRYNCEALIAELDALFAGKSRDGWTALFDEYDVWWAPVNTADDVIVDPQAIAAGAFVDVPAGAGAAAHRAVNTPVRFAGHRDAPTRGVPALGEHTDEVLRELD